MNKTALTRNRANPQDDVARNRNSDFIDHLIAKYELKNDRALCDKLNISPPVVSKIRNGRLNVSGDLKIVIHETLGMSIADIQAFLKS